MVAYTVTMNSLKALQQAARAGGEILQGYFGQTLEVTEKSMASDFRTKADLESEAAILTVLDQEYSHYNIQSEETGFIDRQSEYTFVIDPLDGTNNFSLGIPNFTVSIALLKKEEIVAGVVYQPIIDQMYFAAKGEGAFLEDDQLRVSTETQISKSTVAHGCGYDTPPHVEANLAKDFHKQNIKRVLTNWSIANDFCLLASGKIEGVVIDGSELYDFAAGKIIAKEAGAMVSTFKGEPDADTNRFFFASCNQSIHDAMLAVIQEQKELQ